MFIVFSFTVLDQGGFGHLLKPFLSLAGCWEFLVAFRVTLVVKNPPANSGDM